MLDLQTNLEASHPPANLLDPGQGPAPQTQSGERWPGLQGTPGLSFQTSHHEVALRLAHLLTLGQSFPASNKAMEQGLSVVPPSPQNPMTLQAHGYYPWVSCLAHRTIN